MKTGRKPWAGRWLLLFCTGLPLSATALEVGDQAPDFQLQGSDGQTYRLSQFRGQETVVIAWFPKAYTHGCTIECKSLASNGHLIRRYRVAYFMASVDPLADNRGFAQQQEADFPLLSDPDKTVAAAYGVLTAGGVAARQTFYIDEQGTVVAIDREVDPARSAEDMLARLEQLGVSRR